MGWKRVKDHYQIEHFVQVRDQSICVGSSYIHDLIVIGLDGRIKKRFDGENKALKQVQAKMDADAKTLVGLILAEDTFAINTQVFTFNGGNIITKQCEMAGWPNVTHEGQMMFDNTHSTDKLLVVKWAKSDAQAGIELSQRRLAQLRLDIQTEEADLASFASALATLEKDFPSRVVHHV